MPSCILQYLESTLKCSRVHTAWVVLKLHEHFEGWKILTFIFLTPHKCRHFLRVSGSSGLIFFLQLWFLQLYFILLYVLFSTLIYKCALVPAWDLHIPVQDLECSTFDLSHLFAGRGYHVAENQQTNQPTNQPTVLYTNSRQTSSGTGSNLHLLE